jgi:hypothetical protein
MEGRLVLWQMRTLFDWVLLAFALYGLFAAINHATTTLGDIGTRTARNSLGILVIAENQEDQIEGFLRGLTTAGIRPAQGLFVVDLASTDDTGYIMDRLARDDAGIHVLHLPLQDPSPYESALFLCRSQMTVVVEMRGEVDAVELLNTMQSIW